MHSATNNSALLLQARAVPPKEYTFGEGRAQVVCCLIAAYAMCQFPLDLDLSDGKRHHLLRLRGDQLVEYLNCTPKQVQLYLEAPLNSSKTGSKILHAHCKSVQISCV